MNSKNLIKWMFVLIFTTMLLAGCAPEYTLVCDITTEEFGFEITGETGTVATTSNSETTSYEYDPAGQLTGIIVEVNRDMLFEDNQHSYHIEGTITIDQLVDDVTYDITATGDAFASSPQTCTKP